MNKHDNDKQNTIIPVIKRRLFLKLGLLTAASGLFPLKSIAAVGELFSEERRLDIFNLHTKEYLQAVYWKDGKYIPDALFSINYIFRDHYCGAVKPIDKKLLDLLFSLQTRLGSDEPFYLISGYRTRKTNAFLKKQKRRVSKNSLHIYGKAADIRMPNTKLKLVRRAAYELKTGGVGYYPRANFLHIDVGKVRYW